jgi:hypothetical protein
MTIRARAFFAAVLLVGPAVSAWAEPTNAERIAAARRTVSSNPLCSPRLLGAYYWEIGGRDGAMVSGSATPRGGVPIGSDTVMSVASASKWMYAAYTVEKFGDLATNLPYLTLTSGYSNFRTTDCPSSGTVADCKPGSRNRTEANEHIFHYDGGHMQRHAVVAGLGPLANGPLGAEIRSALGTEIALDYVQPSLAGGVSTSARQYALFLRKLLAGAAAPLQLGSLLGSHAVCTAPSETCNASRLVAVPEAWHYSLGHWIEDDPASIPALAFAYSSPGSFGFYPWIDLGRTYYGVLARQTEAFTGNDEGYVSAQCGRKVRLAWLTGVSQ